MKYEWRYEKLGDVTYSVLDAQIKPFRTDELGQTGMGSRLC